MRWRSSGGAVSWSSREHSRNGAHRRHRAAVPGGGDVKRAANTYRYSPQETFLLLCKAHGIPTPTPEFRFSATRRWRFDYCWKDLRIAVEQNGGIWTRGRHTRGAGQVKDMEKLNAAQLAGYVVGQFTPQQMMSGEAVAWIRAMIEKRKEEAA